MPAEQKTRLAKELEEYERDHSSKYDKRAKPDDDDDPVGKTSEESEKASSARARTRAPANAVGRRRHQRPSAERGKPL